VIEDDASTRELIAGGLGKAGFETLTRAARRDRDCSSPDSSSPGVITIDCAFPG